MPTVRSVHCTAQTNIKQKAYTGAYGLCSERSVLNRNEPKG